MVDFPRFSSVLKTESKLQIKRPGKSIEDNFDWQEDIISKIREWAFNSKINSLEAFRSFDKDFDGLISKQDMISSLQEYCLIKPEDLTQVRMDRLFRLLSFYKTETI